MPKNKQLNFLEDAEKLYVESGLETIAIEGVLKGSVTRRTLDNWKIQYNWDKKRENFRNKFSNFKNNILNLLEVSINQATVEPTNKNIKNVKDLALLALKFGIDLGINADDVDDKTKTPASEKTAIAIRKLLNLPVKK